MTKRKKIKIIIILLIVAILIPINITLSKYVSNFLKNYVIETQEFYFSSDKLEEPKYTYNKQGDIINTEITTYSINNWSGVNSFDIQFSLNNYKNNELKSDGDIEYRVKAKCIGNLTCTMNDTTPEEANPPYLTLTGTGDLLRNDSTTTSKLYTLTAVPLSAFNDNESVTVEIEATSTYPYEKTIKAKFIVTVGKRGVSYEIRDAVGQPYFDLSITNSKEEYKVIEAFDSYTVGTELTGEEYNSLLPENKAKCASAQITLAFDPNYVYADTTSEIINNATKGTTTLTETINNTTYNVNYVSTISFNMNATSGVSIRFYKKSSRSNYTWPNGVDLPIVTMTAN